MNIIEYKLKDYLPRRVDVDHVCGLVPRVDILPKGALIGIDSE